MERTIQTLVFFDTETTGLPWNEKNQTKIIEICFVVVNRNDIMNCVPGSLPKYTKFSSLLNPLRPIHKEVTYLTGLDNNSLNDAPIFEDVFHDIVIFLDNLPKPICLIAHNGNIFDYKILLAECHDADLKLPDDLLCLDSLVAFRKNLERNKQLLCISLNNETTDLWPDLNVSTEEWEEIDKLSTSNVENMMVFQEQKISSKKGSKSKKSATSRAQTKKINKLATSSFKRESNKKKGAFTLTSLYERFLNKQAINAHRAESDCLMLLELFVVLRNCMLPWMDKNCELLHNITPLERY